MVATINVRVVVLQLHELVTKLRAMVVVNQREASGHVLDPRFPRPPREHIADQLAHRLAPRGKLLFFAVFCRTASTIPLRRIRRIARCLTRISLQQGKSHHNCGQPLNL